MAVEQGYPVTLVHPQHKPAVVSVPSKDTGVRETLGQPERFPPITVCDSDDEAAFRAQGYLRYGEAPPLVDRHEYPKMMRHPDYKEAIPSRVEAKIEDGRITGTFTIPATPAVMPDVMVNSKEEEEIWCEKGYAFPGAYNREALESALGGSSYEDTYEPKEYPKWVDGVLVEKDPNAPDMTPSKEYPKLVGGVLVHDPRFPQAPDPNMYPMWVHKDGIPSEESVLVNTPQEEFKVRQKWKPKEEEKEEEKTSELDLESVTKRAKRA